MVEFRFSAVNMTGKVISGTLSAETSSEAKKKIQLLATKNGLKITEVAKKSTFLYKAQKGKDKPVFGEQKAFTGEEVRVALTKLGFTVGYVRKKLLDFNSAPPYQEVVTFVKISAELLEQKLSYGEILNLLINDIENKTLRETVREINNELKKGVDSQQVFLRYTGVFGKFTAYMLGLASKSGNMTEIYRATAKFLERQQEFRKNMKSALITPAVTVFVLFAAVVYYVGYIFPETAKLFLKFGIPLPPMTAFTLKLSEFLTGNILWLLLGTVIGIVAIVNFVRTEKGRMLIDQYMMKLPIIGGLTHKTFIEIFCRVFYTLYSGSAESIEPIRVAAEATGNSYFEHRIKSIAIPLMIKKGMGITDAFKESGVFTDTSLARFHSGEETGTIKNTALQLANYYESETVFRLKNIIEMIQVFIAMFIMIVMILLTLVSAETAVVRPKTPGVSEILSFISQYFV